MVVWDALLIIASSPTGDIGPMAARASYASLVGIGTIGLCLEKQSTRYVQILPGVEVAFRPVRIRS